MKSMWIGGIILIAALIAGTYFSAGDAYDTGDTINNLTMLAGFAIITITVFVALKYVQQMKNDKAGGELAQENWDGIGEYQNPLPTGWALAFIGVLVWTFWYWMVGYPTNGFSQIGQWNEETIEYNKKFESKFNNPTPETLTAMGESIFLVQCAPCHGVDAMGIDGKAQDLTKRILKQSVIHAIKYGGNNFKSAYPGGMPPGMLADDASINEVTDYIVGGFKGNEPATWAVCAGCHGDGSGIPMVGPDLKTYSDDVIAAVLKDGKKANIGIMPNFSGRLNDTQIKALANYIRSIGE